MTNQSEKPFERFFAGALKFRIRRVESELLGKSDHSSIILREILKETLQNELSPEEKGSIERIEELRNIVNISTEEIAVIDYGIGKSWLKLKNRKEVQGQLVIRSVGSICRSSSERYLCSLLLFKLIRRLRPLKCLELGTCLGISTSYQAAGLKINGEGKIVTLEGAESLAELSKKHFNILGLDNVQVVVGRFQDILDRILNDSGTIDFAFVDGHHTKDATLNYFEKIIPFISPNGIVIFDDIIWSQGMRQAWRRIRSDRRVKMAINLWQIGICIIDNTKGAYVG